MTYSEEKSIREKLRIAPRAGRMNSVKRHRQDSAFKRWCRWLSGDWWQLETLNGSWGVWHPWKSHIWENYRFTKEEAEKEAMRLNSGRDYQICQDCGTTYASHHSGQYGGIKCPNISQHA